MCAVICARRCGSTNDHRDSLKFVQEVARFVTSRFFEEKKMNANRCMGMIRKPMGEFWPECWAYTPTLFSKDILGFLMTTEIKTSV